MIESSHFLSIFVAQIIISDVVKNDEGGNVLGEGGGEFSEPGEGGSEIATGSRTGLSTGREGDDLLDNDVLSEGSDAGWDTDLDIEGTGMRMYFSSVYLQLFTLLIYPFTCPSIHSLTHSSIYSPIHPFTHSFIHLLTHSSIYSPIYPFILFILLSVHPFTPSIPLSVHHSFFHPLLIYPTLLVQLL